MKPWLLALLLSALSAGAQLNVSNATFTTSLRDGDFLLMFTGRQAGAGAEVTRRVLFQDFAAALKINATFSNQIGFGSLLATQFNLSGLYRQTPRTGFTNSHFVLFKTNGVDALVELTTNGQFRVHNLTSGSYAWMGVSGVPGVFSSGSQFYVQNQAFLFETASGGRSNELRLAHTAQITAASGTTPANVLGDVGFGRVSPGLWGLAGSNAPYGHGSMLGSNFTFNGILTLNGIDDAPSPYAITLEPVNGNPAPLPFKLGSNIRIGPGLDNSAAIGHTILLTNGAGDSFAYGGAITLDDTRVGVGYNLVATGATLVVGANISASGANAGAVGDSLNINAANAFAFGRQLTNTLPNSVDIGASNATKLTIAPDGVTFRTQIKPATNAFTRYATNTTAIPLDFSQGAFDLVMLDYGNTNLHLFPTNLAHGREITVFLRAATVNYDVSVTNAAANVVYWPLQTATNGSTALTVTNGQGLEISLRCVSNTVWASFGRFR
jgi:hypothetical protein